MFTMSLQILTFMTTVMILNWHEVTSQTTRTPLTVPYTDSCLLTRSGREYAGPVSTTSSGLICQPWSSDDPHLNYYKTTDDFPEGSANAAGNRCRNPQHDYNEGLWCYTMDPATRWQRCNVSFCECKLGTDVRGVGYLGRVSTTRTGRTCQRWTSRSPQPHSFNASSFFPDANVLSASNYCRNPNGSQPLGPWCFTTDRNVRWEYCFVPVCNFTTVVFPRTTSRVTTGAAITTQVTTSSTSRTTTRTTRSTTTTRRTTSPSQSTPTGPSVSTINEFAESTKESTGLLVAKIVVPIGVVLVAVVVFLVLFFKRRDIFPASIPWNRLLVPHFHWPSFSRTKASPVDRPTNPGNRLEEEAEAEGQDGASTSKKKVSSPTATKNGSMEPGFDNPIYVNNSDYQRQGSGVVVGGVTIGSSDTEGSDGPRTVGITIATNSQVSYAPPMQQIPLS